MPYSEMAGHCEALLVGKQHKMSAVMSVQQNQESLASIFAKEVQPHSHVESGSLKVLTCIMATVNISYSIKMFILVIFLSTIEIVQGHSSNWNFGAFHINFST